MFEEGEKQGVDGDELSEEELKQIKAMPQCEHDWSYFVVTSATQSQVINVGYVYSGSFPDNRAFLMNSLA